MIRFKKPNKIKRGMLLIDKRTKDILEVIKTSVKGFETQSLYNKSRHFNNSIDGLFVLVIPKEGIKPNEIENDEYYVDFNDFIVVLDDEDTLVYAETEID